MSIDNLELLKPDMNNKLTLEFINEYESKLRDLKRSRDEIKELLDKNEVYFPHINKQYNRLNNSIASLEKLINEFKEKYKI